MPQPLPGAILGGIVPDPRPIFPSAFDVGSARVKLIAGPIAALEGSIIYPDSFAYGFVSAPGLLTLNRGRKGLRRTLRGVEDGNGRQI